MQEAPGSVRTLSTFAQKTFRRGYGLGLCLPDPSIGQTSPLLRIRSREISVFELTNGSTGRRTKERQSASVSISGSARRSRLLRAAITSIVTVVVLLLVWR